MARQPIDLRTDERSVGDLFGDLSRGLSELMRDEVRLAKTEVREEAAKARQAGAAFGAATLAAYLCVLLLSLAAAWGLAELIAPGLAFLIVGALYGVVAAVLFTRGRSSMKRLHVTPDETVTTLKEDARWARAQLK